jgi:hypothetical protein
MADTYKILCQVVPLATTETTIYTVPASTSVVISSLVVCNRGATSSTFRVSIAEDGDATGITDYLYYDVTIPGNDTFILTGGLTAGETDEFRVYASSGNLTFQLFGSEVT